MKFLNDDYAWLEDGIIKANEVAAEQLSKATQQVHQAAS